MNVPNGTCSLNEKGCFTDGKCYYNRNCENKVVTNADRIRSMSDEELARWLCENTGWCERCVGDEVGCSAELNGYLNWLKQPVKEGEDE